MNIETITSSEKDSEVHVTCNKCGANEYFDPRPWRCCSGCMAARAIDFIRQCANCGDVSEPTGDIEWLEICTPIEKSEYDRVVQMVGDTFDAELNKLIRD